jgi:hypothetical protein
MEKLEEIPHFMRRVMLYVDYVCRNYFFFIPLKKNNVAIVDCEHAHKRI